MELLKELFDIYASIAEAKSDKKKEKTPALKMKKVTSFVAGNMVMSGNGEAMSEAKKSATIVVKAPAPRNKQLNDVLSTRKGGRHYDPKSDYVRAKEKHKARRMDESEEGYWRYEATTEYKNRGGDGGPETYTRSNDGYVRADSKEAALAKAKSHNTKAYDVRVSAATKADYDRYMAD